MHKRMPMMVVAISAMIFATACNKDDDVNAFVGSLTSFTDELVGKVGEGDLGPGLDQAIAYLEENSERMKAEYGEVALLRGYQVSEEAKGALTSAVTSNVSKVNQLRITHMRATISDAGLREKLTQLVNGYNSIFDAPAS